MTQIRDQAIADFMKTMKWIILGGILLVAAVLGLFAYLGELHVSMVLAIIGGVFISVVLGCGLFALGFFSDRSGHDDDVTNATNQKPENRPDSYR